MSSVLYRRARLGAGALLGVLLLVAAAGGLLGVYYAERADAERRGEDREAGRVFAMWFGAMHRASMVENYRVTDAVTGEVTGVNETLVSQSDLESFGVVPPGLPSAVGKVRLLDRDVDVSLGIIDDDGGFHVPMAFAVMEPQPWANTGSLREGALEGGLAELAEVAVPGSEMHANLGRIEAVLGRPVRLDGMFVTADRGVRYQDRVLYRRAQPGQSRLNRMQTELNAKGCGPGLDEPCDIVNGGMVAARNILVTPNALVPKQSTVGGEAVVDAEVEAGSMDVLGTCADAMGVQVMCSHPDAVEDFCLDASGARVLCSAPLAVAPSGTFDGEEVKGESSFVVIAELVMESGEAVTSLVGVDMTVIEQVHGVDLVATTVTAPAAVVSTSIGVTGLSNIGILGSSTMGVGGSFVTAAGWFRGLYGPSANIGSLLVGSCAGCYLP